MDLILTRRDRREDGIFGEICSEKGEFLFITLERSYALKPKIKPGKYKCVRGMHRLENMTEEFETFEVKGVKGHWGILFHVGNYNEQTNGCILVGLGMGNKMGGGKMITSSKQAFKKFMDLQAGVDEFYLIVTN